MNKKYSLPVNKYTIQEDNDDFLFVRLQIIAEGLNRNDSVFLLEGMEKCKETFREKPLLCAFPKELFGNDYKIGDAHNSVTKIDPETNEEYYSYLDDGCEKCIGFIPKDSSITIENIDGVNWIVLYGYIWKKYNFELCKQLTKKRRQNKNTKISVEIEITKGYEKDDIAYIEEFIGDAVTLLALNGSVAEGIAGANLITYCQSDKYSKFKQEMSFALNKDKPSKESMDNNDAKEPAYIEPTNDDEDDDIDKNEEFKKVITNTFSNLSKKQIEHKIYLVLDSYTYEENDYEYQKYYIEDLYDNRVIVHDFSTHTLYEIPYSIDESDEICVDMDSIKEVEITYAPTTTNFAKKEVFLSKEKMGSGDKLKVDKSKESLSDKAWGEVNKTSLRNNILIASNYKSLVKDVYMKVEEDWEDAPSEKLKYPVMLLEGDTLKYCKGGLSSALAYAEKENETTIVNKIKKIRKKLGLETKDTNKKEGFTMNKELMKKFTKNGFKCFAIDEKDNKAYLFKEGKVFAVDSNKEEMAEGDMKEMSVTMGTMDEAETTSFNAVEMVKCMAEMADDNVTMSIDNETMKANESCHAKEKEEMAKENETIKCEKESMAKEKEEMSAKYDELSKSYEEMKCEKEEMAKKLEAKEDEIRMAQNEKLKCEAQEVYASKEERMDVEFKAEIKTKIEECKYSDIKEVEKDIAYAMYVFSSKEEVEKEKENKEFSYSLNKNNKQPNEPTSVFDEI